MMMEKSGAYDVGAAAARFFDPSSRISRIALVPCPRWDINPDLWNTAPPMDLSEGGSTFSHSAFCSRLCPSSDQL